MALNTAHEHGCNFTHGSCSQLGAIHKGHPQKFGNFNPPPLVRIWLTHLPLRTSAWAYIIACQILKNSFLNDKTSLIFITD